MVIAAGAVLLSACAHEAEVKPQAQLEVGPGEWITVEPVLRAGLLTAAGNADPYAEATVSTKLMGTVVSVAVREGDRVGAGAVLARIDARELTAKAAQVEAGVAEAEAMQREALTHANRMRALFADDAAPRAQLDAAETGLARAEAAVRAARAGASELAAVSTYARVTSPFAGTVIQRFVDPGAFAAPGAPLVTVQDASRLRVSVMVAPSAIRQLKRGDEINATIEDMPASAIVEGIVPAGGSLYTVNAIVDNREGAFLPGSAATLLLPQAPRSAMVVPRSAIRREGDLTGVMVRSGETAELRWVRLAPAAGDSVEVLSGLRAGEAVRVPAGEAN